MINQSNKSTGNFKQRIWNYTELFTVVVDKIIISSKIKIKINYLFCFFLLLYIRSDIVAYSICNMLTKKGINLLAYKLYPSFSLSGIEKTSTRIK